MFPKTRICFLHIVFAVMASLLMVISVSAQEFRYHVELDRPIGHRDGRLIISDKHIEYLGAKRPGESRTWEYQDIRLLELLSPTKLRLWTYKDRYMQLGGDQGLTFRLIDGQFDQNISNFLRERIKRPFVTSFVEADENALAEIPVKHSHRTGGCEGMLKVYADRLVYESGTGHDSRTWLWTDIRSVGRSDIYRFDVETFEPQLGVSSRSFNFVLKEQMPDKTYDLIWARVYRPTPLIRVGASAR